MKSIQALLIGALLFCITAFSYGQQQIDATVLPDLLRAIRGSGDITVTYVGDTAIIGGGGSGDVRTTANNTFAVGSTNTFLGPIFATNKNVVVSRIAPEDSDPEVPDQTCITLGATSLNLFGANYVYLGAGYAALKIGNVEDPDVSPITFQTTEADITFWTDTSIFLRAPKTSLYGEGEMGHGGILDANQGSISNVVRVVYTDGTIQTSALVAPSSITQGGASEGDVLAWSSTANAYVPTTLNEPYRPGLFAEFLMDEGYGRFLYNNVHPKTPNVSLAWPQEQTMTSAGGWAGAVSDNVAANPFGEMTASAVSLAGGGYMMKSYTFKSGIPYTCSFYMKSNTNVVQNFRFCTDSVGLSTNCPVPETWTKFSYTFVGSGGGYMIPVFGDAENNPLKVLMWGIQYEMGSNATAKVDRYYDCVLGSTFQPSAANDPTWTQYGLFFTNSGFQYASGPSKQPLSVQDSSVYAVVRRRGPMYLAGYQAICGTIGTGMSGYQLYTTPGTAIGPRFVYSGVNEVNSPGGTLEDGLWHVVSGTYDGFTARTWIDDNEMGIAYKTNAAPQLIRNLGIANLNDSATWSGDIAYLSLYNVGHTPTQHRENVRRIRALMAKRGISLPGVDVTALEGDSIMAAMWPSIATNGNWRQLRNYAVSGSGIPDLVTRSTGVKATYNPDRRNAYFVLIGANDLGGGENPVTATNYFNGLKALCTDMKTNGWTVIVSTPLPGAAAGFNANRAIAINLMVNDTSFYDRLIRIDTNSVVGVDAAASDPTYYPDGQHPSAACNQIIGPIYKAEIETFMR